MERNAGRPRAMPSRYSSNERPLNAPLNVVVEEVHVQARLYDATKVHHPVVLVVCFVVRPVYPVHDVQRTVRAEEENIVTRQVFYLAVSLQYDELRDDGHCLQVDGNLPQVLPEQGGGRSA